MICWGNWCELVVEAPGCIPVRAFFIEAGLPVLFPISSMKCPICRKETVWEENPFRPFCSERCRMIDLGKWASEEYRIPDVKNPKPDDSAETASDE